MATGRIHYGVGDSIGFGVNGGGGSGVGSFSKSALSNMAVGDLLIAWIHCQSTVAGATITPPAGWVRYGAPVGAPTMTASRLSGFYYYPLRSTTDITNLPATITWTFSDSSTRVACVVARATGIDLGVIEDVTSPSFSTLGNTSSLSVAGIATAHTDTLLVAGVHHQNAINTSSPATTSLLTAFEEYRTDPDSTHITTAGNSGAAMGYSVLSTADATGAVVATFDQEVSVAGGELVAFTLLGSGAIVDPTPYIIGTPTVFKTGAATLSFTIDKPSGIQDGDALILVLSAQSPTATSDFTSSGWSRIGLPFTPSSGAFRLIGFYALPVPSAAALTQPNFTFTTTDSAAGGRVTAELIIVRGAELSNLVSGYSPSYASSNGTNPTVAALTTKVSHSLQLTMFGSQVVAGVDYSVSGMPDGMALQTSLVSSTTNQSKTTLNVYLQTVDAGSSGTKTQTWTANQSQSSGSSVAIRALGHFDPNANVGTALQYTSALSTLSPARLFYTSATDTLSTPIEVRPLPTGYVSVSAMLATPQFSIAHRGGSANWPEMSLHSYTQSAFWGMGALEVSLARTSDGVWFGLHDATLDRTSGTTGFTASAHTWAEVQAYQITASATNNGGQPTRPYMRWEELMAAYYKTHVIFVDPKNAAAYASELLDMMDAMPGTTIDRFVAKYYGVSSGWPTQARARGYKTWGYFYQADAANFAAYQGRWDILGMDFNADQASWDAIRSYGKPVIGHIVSSSAAATTAYSKGAVGLMVSGVQAVVPRSV